MQEQPRRKPRTPLSPEELFYVIELKKIRQFEKLEKFKATAFYKITNRVNIFLAGFLTYCIISILILSSWQTTYVLWAECEYGPYDPAKRQRTISEVRLNTTSNEILTIRTDNLFTQPKKLDEIYLGKDLIFNKTMKVKLVQEENVFWSVNAYASLTVCTFALVLGFFIYQVNKHQTVNGLLMTTGLFVLASLYFILV